MTTSVTVPVTGAMGEAVSERAPDEQAKREIHELVRAHYGERAATRTSCCGPAASSCAPEGSSCCAPGAIELSEEDKGTLEGKSYYSADELAGIEADAAEFSLGCGNPTAIAGLEPGQVVLDLGSGGGLDVFLAARRVGPSGFVYGVDMTDEMLELARSNAAKMGVENVEFRKGQIEDIPLDAQSVDVIISNCVVNLSPDKEQVLRETFRVLKPGGRIAISDIVVDGTLDDLPVSEVQIRTALSWAGCIAGALTIDQYVTLLGAVGFEDVQVDVRHHYSLEMLGQTPEEVAGGIPADVVDELVGRFTSSIVTGRRPA